MDILQKIHYVLTSPPEYAAKVSALRDKNKLAVWADMMCCLLLQRIHPSEYAAMGFDSIPRSLRATYMTTKHLDRINRTIDDPRSVNLLCNKYYAGTVLAPYYKRPCLQNINLSYEDFLAFVQGRDKFICKPSNGYGGEGHKIYKMDGSRSPDEIYQEIMSAPRSVLEGWIVQHEALNKFYAGAVHTVRLHTIHDGSGKDVKVFGSNISIAYDGEVANTHYMSTLCALVDDATGVITTDGLQRDTDKIFVETPNTHVKFRGFQLPDWDKTLHLVKMAAAAIPEIQFIGWDVAFTPEGPVICEGNVSPGVTDHQHYAWYTNGQTVGCLSMVKPYLKTKK